MKNKQRIIDALAKAENASCRLCGCAGIHACMGKKIEWTEDDELRIQAAMKKIFGKEQETNE